MGRDGKEFKDLHLKFERWIYDDLKKYVDKFNKENNQNYSITKFIETAVYEYLERNQG